MFKWYITGNFGFKVLKIVVLIYESLLYGKHLRPICPRNCHLLIDIL